VIANEIIVKAMDHGGRLCAMASEEEPDIIQIPDGFRCGKYVLTSTRSTARRTSTSTCRSARSSA
jgi:fructose-1,6-bisphosphatase